jgi:hypothetical protein
MVFFGTVFKKVCLTEVYGRLPQRVMRVELSRSVKIVRLHFPAVFSWTGKTEGKQKHRLPKIVTNLYHPFLPEEKPCG